jgi:hypothetical protein
MSEFMKYEKKKRTPGQGTFGRKKIPHIPGPMSYVQTHGHMSPRVILDEIRDARMLSPRVQRDFLRSRSKQIRSELPAVSLQVPRTANNRLYLPKNKLEHYSKRILKQPIDWALLDNPVYGTAAVRNTWKNKILKFVKHLH